MPCLVRTPLRQQALHLHVHSMQECGRLAASACVGTGITWPLRLEQRGRRWAAVAPRLQGRPRTCRPRRSARSPGTRSPAAPRAPPSCAPPRGTYCRLGTTTRGIRSMHAAHVKCCHAWAAMNVGMQEHDPSVWLLIPSRHVNVKRRSMPVKTGCSTGTTEAWAHVLLTHLFQNMVHQVRCVSKVAQHQSYSEHAICPGALF